MKKQLKNLVVALFAIIALALVGCHRNETITVSDNDLWFSELSESQTFTITSDCSWTIEKNETANWYTISPTSGEKTNTGTVVTVTVNELENNNLRKASFTITSKRGTCTVNMPLTQVAVEFDNILNTVFGVKKVEQWNTDFYGNPIEDTHFIGRYDPFDTTYGYTMYFLEDSTGVQVDRHKHQTVYYPFQYAFDSQERNLYIDFLLEDSTHESYNASVLLACDAMFRLQHEYKPHFWEKIDMAKIGTIDPGEKSILKKAISKSKRKGGGPIFNME